MKTASYAHHLSAYAWACQFIRAKTVLEIGCGEGYGLTMMSWFAKSLRGVDNAKVFLQRATKRQYDCPTLVHHVDLDSDFLIVEEEVVVAFEILEHLKDPRTLLAHLASHTKKLIFSIPHDCPHPLHLHDFKSIEDAKVLVEPYFSVDWYYMRKGVIQKTPFESPDRYLGVATPK